MGGVRLVKLAWWLPLCAAACQYPALPRVAESSDAGGSSPSGSPDAFVAIDAPVASPTGFVPLHVLPASLQLGAPDLVMNGGGIDTDALTIAGNPSPHFIRQGNYAILFTGVFAVQSSLAVQGASPLIIVASGHVNIIASINASADADVAGPGATTAGIGPVGVSFFDGAAGVRKSAGGGGGSYGSLGGVGGSDSPSIAPGGSAGTMYGGSPQDPLVGGSRGGAGGFSGGSGGGGGGAIQISSGVSIDVLATISVGGGGGVGGHTGLNGGSGGGAGGEILLEAPTIAFQNTGPLSLNALGGGGGAGGNQNGGGTPGGDGSDATMDGAGGTAGVPHSSPGGAGALMSSDTFVDAQPGGASGADGGGGGGGAGRIWLRYRASSATPTPHAGPTPGLDPTLP
jgi:hypothetical protein